MAKSVVRKGLNGSGGIDGSTSVAIAGEGEVRHHGQGRETASFLGDTLQLQSIENSGAFLHLGAPLPDRWPSNLLAPGAVR